MLVFIAITQKLAQALLSKTLKQINNHSLGSGTASGQYSFTATSDVKGKWYLNFYINYAYSFSGSLSITHNWDTIDYGSKSAKNNFTFDNVMLYVWDIITFTSANGFNGQNYSFSFSYQEFPPSKLYKLYNLKEIWEKVTAYLFGMLKDGTRRNWE